MMKTLIQMKFFNAPATTKDLYIRMTQNYIDQYEARQQFSIDDFHQLRLADKFMVFLREEGLEKDQMRIFYEKTLSLQPRKKINKKYYLDGDVGKLINNIYCEISEEFKLNYNNDLEEQKTNEAIAKANAYLAR